jgi:hypothetical protein
MNILQRAQKLDPNPLPGARPSWIDRPILKNWQHRLLNKNQIPESYTDVLEGAVQFLDHLQDPDHRNVIKYLTKVPTLNDIALGIIQGRAGVGKTFMLSQVCAAKLRANKNTKILIVTPSNDPTNVVARKVWEEVQTYEELKNIIYMRAHNVTAEKNYIAAYGKLETLKAKLESDKTCWNNSFVN